MTLPSTASPIDYLLIGHLTEDLLPDDQKKLGGTASFASLTARALGHHVGLVTSCRPDLDLTPLADIQVTNLPAPNNTTFRNVPSESGRQQFAYHPAGRLELSSIPAAWQKSPIVHLGPVAGEIDPALCAAFPNSLVGVTLQGWLRRIGSDHRVHKTRWPFQMDLLQAADAVVLSMEDLDGDENEVEILAGVCQLLVITESYLGARVYWKGDIRRFPAPQVRLVEDTGAGDIFAACFFHRFSSTRDPWEAARFAVALSSASVTRSYFESIPTAEEISAAKLQIL